MFLFLLRIAWSCVNDEFTHTVDNAMLTNFNGRIASFVFIKYEKTQMVKYAKHKL